MSCYGVEKLEKEGLNLEREETKGSPSNMVSLKQREFKRPISLSLSHSVKCFKTHQLHTFLSRTIRQIERESVCVHTQSMHSIC